jgi:hypothetical protein
LEGTAVAAHPHGQVVLHDLADLRLAEELVGPERVLDARGRVRVAGGDEAEILRRVGVVSELAEATGQLVAVPSEGIRSPRISREIVE